MTAKMNPTSEQLLGLHWLIRLRWIAVCVFVVICLVSVSTLGIALPIQVVASCIGLIVLSNGWLAWYRRRTGGRQKWLIPSILVLDIVILTVMLYFSGGANNPFTLFYLLHMTMAVILLPAWGAWSVVTLCSFGFSILFFSNHDLVSTKGYTCCDDMRTHLQGLVVAMVLTGCGIAYFVSRLAAGLRGSRNLVALTQAEGERARRSAEVATLAAGIAHELATPLGTIAVVSQDLEKLAAHCGVGGECVEDARVIRKEVERCRQIIEKLGMAHRNSDRTSAPLEWEQLGDLLVGYLAETIRERLVLTVQPSSKRPHLPQDRLLQCLSILIKNGAEASPPESPVTLDAEIVSDSCIFRVTDYGPGFPPGFEQRIGEPLVTNKSKSGGLGLGLFLVNAFVAERGGALNLESGSIGETVVVMRVPLVENKAQ